jgi:transcriptional antiterminator NusG
MQWYIVHVRSGFEKKVRQSIHEQLEKMNLAPRLGKIVIPAEEVTELRRGKKVQVEHKFFPGYVLLEADLDDVMWHVIQKTPYVTNFLGSSGRPQAVPESQIAKILQQMSEGTKPARSLIQFDVGEVIKIIDGPFESFTGVVEAVDDLKERLRLSVTIFGRSTQIELDFFQVVKLDRA